MPLRLTIENGLFRDDQGRQVTLRGINVAGDAKFPSKPDQPSHISTDFFNGDAVNFRSRPFPADEAHIHFSRLKRWGYNTIRYVLTWEAIEPSGPGVYDDEWIQHTISVLKVAKSYGFYVFLDPHQDVWSRFSGGSGAPMWTFYLAGLNPQSFAATEAALVHNTYPDPETFPKMIWSTNYQRLACEVMFTMFFAGRHFTPKCIVDGMNIQDYLQQHFINACAYLAKAVNKAGLEDVLVIGWESINEPNHGLIGWQDLTAIPSELKNLKGTCPTPWQSMLTGSGRSCEVDTYDIGGLGPFKSGRALVDPQGESAWLPADYDDSRYGYKRDPGWKLGECVWAQHGIWNPENDKMLKKDYFAKHPDSGVTINYEEFTNSYWIAHYRKFRDTIRSIHKNSILFCQPPTLELPPSIKNTPDDDPKMVYAPHFYDGITLMTKKWNRYWNVDVLGILRGRYYSPAFGVKVGETAIRNCFKDQLNSIRQEGVDYMGNHPCVLTEFGIPYDMDDKHAYKTGDYSSQSGALDANHYALEGSGMAGYTLWLYMSQNQHHLGDQWNGEDLSIFSLDDRPLPLSAIPPTPMSRSTITLNSSPEAGIVRELSDDSTISPGNLKANLKTPSIASTPSNLQPELTIAPGFRAAEAYVRPSPIYTVGERTSSGFDLRNCIFSFRLLADKATSEENATEIFLPEFHFPKEKCEVQVSGGKWSISTDEEDGGLVQRLKWWHKEGEQSMTVTGVVRKHNIVAGNEDEEGYLEQCQQTKCAVM